jgi:hypothetical protein
VRLLKAEEINQMLKQVQGNLAMVACREGNG